jgi:hypothetical protein
MIDFSVSASEPVKEFQKVIVIALELFETVVAGGLVAVAAGGLVAAAGAVGAVVGVAPVHAANRLAITVNTKTIETSFFVNISIFLLKLSIGFIFGNGMKGSNGICWQYAYLFISPFFVKPG